ncbi:MAG: DMT family transporter [Chlamydiae bacterium]|nr:DMT family transporter [Chlamydiota bacterium]
MNEAESPPFINGVLLIIFAWVFFTVMIAISRYVSPLTSIPIVLLFQNGISLLFILPWMIEKGKTSFHTPKYHLLILRTVAGYLNFTFIFLAVQRTSLVNTLLLSNSAPIFIPLIIWIWRRIAVGYKLWLGIIIGFIGIGLILKPDIDFMNTGVLFALGSAISFSISMIAQRRLIKTEPKYTILFYYFLAGTLISFPFAIYTWNIPLTILPLLILIGVLSVIGQLAFLQALQFGKPSALSPFNYISVVYAAIIEWIIWNQFPDLFSILGIILISVGGILTMIYENKPIRKF